ISAMSRRIDFYYDILSPYSYLGFEVLCRHRSVWNLVINFRPFLLRGVMQSTGNRSPGSVQLKADYMLGRDLPRLSKHYRVPLVMNDKVVERMFKIGTMSTMQFLTAMQKRQPDAVEEVSRQLFYRLFSSHQDVAQPDSLRAAAEAAGLSADVTAAALTDMLSDEVKSRLKTVTDEAVKLGAFGSPTFIVHTEDGRQEMVFGSDRFHIIGDLLGVEYKGPLRHLARL
ncbi:hypothetical protein BOX15_Mlig031261g4, partial [Macrostomum lignano]